MISESEVGTYDAGAGNTCIATCRRPGHSFPVDYDCETPVDRLTVNARAAYIVDLDDTESIRCAGYGLHHLCGNREMVVLESDDRLYITPEDDCILEYDARSARLQASATGSGMAAVGVKKMPGRTIITDTEPESLFRCISSICTAPGDLSPYRSHPFYRQSVPDISITAADIAPDQTPPRASIAFRLPRDLRYLYAAAPLSFYLGASLEIGGGPSVEIRGVKIDLPAGYRQFERWAGRMLGRTFQADCAVRYSAATGRCLPGFDVREVFGYAPEELMLMSMPDRFRLYLEKRRSCGRDFDTWHSASYVDPVPSSIGLMPYLFRSLSSVYAPAYTPASERDVISMSVRHYMSQAPVTSRGDADCADMVLLPSLYDAQDQLWFSGGCPVDATLSSINALKNGRNYLCDRKTPEVCIICNEGPMMREALLIRDLLDGIATVDVRPGLCRSDLIHTFSEGFDILHYTGHSERSGLTCPDGYADLSSAEDCNVPFFFLNCCSSYIHGTRLIEKGSVCGIATMFRVIDEAAMDVCESFYRMLACGYPVTTSILGARECSVTGKEYLLIGDGSYNVFNSRGAVMPFYRLRRNGSGFSIQCTMYGRDKGFVFNAGNDRPVPDTGFGITCMHADELLQECYRWEGMCLYSGRIYDSVTAAVKAALDDTAPVTIAAKGRRSYAYGL